MLMELSESTTEKNIINIFNYLFEEGSNESYKKFMHLINEKNNMAPDEFIFELENIFMLHTRDVIDISYRSAINHVIRLNKPTASAHNCPRLAHKGG